MPARSPTQLLDALRTARGRYDAPARAAKIDLAARLRHHPPRTAAGLAAWADHLLFLRAFPDDVEVLAAALDGLQRAGRRIARLPRRERDALTWSGLPGTRTDTVFAADLTCWLSGRLPGTLRIDWGEFAEPEQLDPLLRDALCRAEEDAFDSGEISTRDWLELAAGGRQTDLDWVCRQRPGSGPAARAWARRLDGIELPVAWPIGTEQAVTAQHWPTAPRAFRTALRPTPGVPTRWVNRPLESIVLLDPAVAEAAIDASRLAIAVRGREVHAITTAHPDEVYLADLGEGISAVIMGARPDARMSLETNYGYVLFGNGVPIGYGGVTPLFHQANTGLNIFPAFRGSEAGAIYLQLLRAFRSLFGVSRFLLNPIQLGEGNEEALASGAFWFYWRLGFRPVDRERRALAAREHRARQARPGHRTSRATLLALSEGDLVLTLPRARGKLFDEWWLHQLSLAVTRSLAGHDGARPRILARVEKEVDRRLGAGSRRGWTREERDGFAQLAPLVGLLDLDNWKAAERRALLELMRAKGRPVEREFAAGCRDHPRLQDALERLARRSAAAAGGAP